MSDRDSNDDGASGFSQPPTFEEEPTYEEEDDDSDNEDDDSGFLVVGTRQNASDREEFESDASSSDFGDTEDKFTDMMSTQTLDTRANHGNLGESQSKVDGGQLNIEVGQLSVDSDHIFSRSPRDDCLYDGRLIHLTEDTIKNLRNENIVQIGRGSFGKVYKSLHPSKDFKMHVVVKKIPLNDGQERTIRRAIKNEPATVESPVEPMRIEGC